MERAREEQFPHIFSISLCILVIMPFRIFWDPISPYNQSRYVKNEYDPIFSPDLYCKTPTVVCPSQWRLEILSLGTHSSAKRCSKRMEVKKLLWTPVENLTSLGEGRGYLFQDHGPPGKTSLNVVLNAHVYGIFAYIDQQ